MDCCLRWGRCEATFEFREVPRFGRGGSKRTEASFTGHLSIPTQQEWKSQKHRYRRRRLHTTYFGLKKLRIGINTAKQGYPREIMTQIKSAFSFSILHPLPVPRCLNIKSPAEEKSCQMNFLTLRYGEIMVHSFQDNSRETRGKRTNLKISKWRLKTPEHEEMRNSPQITKENLPSHTA